MNHYWKRDANYYLILCKLLYLNTKTKTKQEPHWIQLSYSPLSVEEWTHQNVAYFTLDSSLHLHYTTCITQKQFIGILLNLIALIFHSFNIFIQFSCPLHTIYITLFFLALLKMKVTEKVTLFYSCLFAGAFGKPSLIAANLVISLSMENPKQNSKKI